MTLIGRITSAARAGAAIVTGAILADLAGAADVRGAIGHIDGVLTYSGSSGARHFARLTGIAVWIARASIRAIPAEPAVAELSGIAALTVVRRLARAGRTRIACATGGIAADSAGDTVIVLALAVARASCPVCALRLARSRGGAVIPRGAI